jgi:hypothetical protein
MFETTTHSSIVVWTGLIKSQYHFWFSSCHADAGDESQSLGNITKHITVDTQVHLNPQQVHSIHQGEPEMKFSTTAPVIPVAQPHQSSPWSDWWDWPAVRFSLTWDHDEPFPPQYEISIAFYRHPGQEPWFLDGWIQFGVPEKGP